MRILHYSLGFPPYRSGGMTKFCVDLMNQQVKNEDDVSLLWPGQIIGKRIHIKNRKNVHGIKSYELINPLPIPYDEGISNIDAFTLKGDNQVFIRFLNELKPEVIHIHTFMGLYSSFIEVARELGIKTVFTTHDFFPMCPKVTMYRNKKVCDSVATCRDCAQCNSNALNLTKIQLLQSPLYKNLKNTKVVKRLRKLHRDDFFDEEKSEFGETSQGPDDYLRLRSYYLSMLDMIDVIHYNSSVTQSVYERILGERRNSRIPITHSAIVDHRKNKEYKTNELRIRYLGPQVGAKGFFLLKAALDELWKERQNFILDIHFEPIQPSPYMRVHNRYEYDELGSIFEETDVLVAPSILYETFGFTVLEALSYGVPVIISGTVGAKDIITDNAGIVIDDISAKKLQDVIKHLTKEKLKHMNQSIVAKQEIMTLQNMTKRIVSECYLED